MNKIKLLYILISIFLFSAFAANAQYMVKGLVVDKQTLEPLPVTTVSIPNAGVAVQADDNGRFQISSPANFDSIYVDLVGYKHQSVYVGDKTQLITIRLQTTNLLNTVEIVGAQQPQSVTTLSQADLTRTSGLNLQDALNDVPGVNMESRSPWGGQHIIIRGYYPSADNGRTNGENFNGLGYQLFINNIPVTDATGTTVMDDIDMANLGRVDIIKGPSALYGSYIAGAVNLYTPTPMPNESSVKEQFIAGSYGLISTNTSLMTSDGKMDLWVNYGHQQYNGFRPNDSSRKDFASFAGNFYTSSKNTVSTYFSYNHSNEQLAGEIDSAAFYGRQAVSDANYVGNNSRVEIESFRAGITDKYSFNDKFSNQTTVYATGSELSQYFAHGFDLDNNINFGGRTAFELDTKARSVTINGILGASIEKSNQSAQGDFILPFVLSPFTQTSPHLSPSDAQNFAVNSSIFTQWTFSLPSHLSLVVGGSLNMVEFGTQNLLYKDTIYLANPVYKRSYSPVFTPDVSLIKVLNKNVSVYASFSSGYAPPLLSQMTNSAGRVDSALKPESAMQYEIGTRGTLGAARKFSYQLALYDMDITNRLTSETVNSVTSYVNAGEERNLGAELYLGYNIYENRAAFLSLARVWATYTYSDYTYVNFKTYTASKSGGDSVTANYDNNKVAEVSPNVFNIGLDFASKTGFYLHISYRYNDKAPVTFDNYHYMSSYDLLSAKLGYTKEIGKHVAFDIFAGGDNLLNSTYYNFIFVGDNIQELAQGNDPYIKNGGGDGYILPAPYKATFYGGLSLKYKF